MTTLTQAHVKNFQSIADVTVDFGKFTVMVGPSSSGKSAFLRGVRSCVRNSFVPSNVRQGTTKSEVDIEFDDGAQVSIERGKSLSTYKMNHGADVFTKSARAVPEEVEAQLRLPLVASVDPFFSFQFDKPFLLSDSGSVAAQVLGSLTNVSTLHQAVREANRRRQEVLNVVKVREQDVRDLQLDLESYRDLPLRKQEIVDAEELFEQTQVKQSLADDLSSALSVLRSTQEAIDSFDGTAPEDLSEQIVRIRELNSEVNSLSTVTQTLVSVSSALRSSVETAKRLKADVDLTSDAYHDRLVELGKCPTCGASTTE